MKPAIYYITLYIIYFYVLFASKEYTEEPHKTPLLRGIKCNNLKQNLYI